MKDNALKKHVQEMCKQHRYQRVQDFFVAAFENVFGKRRGVRKEARHAARSFNTSGSITERARTALLRFISFLTSGRTATG